MSGTPSLAYVWGEDAFGIERATRAWAARLAADGASLETHRVSLEDDVADEGATTASAARRRARALDAIEEQLATMPLFGGGTLVLVRQPAALLAESSARDRLVSLIGRVPPGNALGVTDLVATGAKAPAARGVLRDVIAEAGGLVVECPVPSGARLEGWLVERATELGTSLDPGAARLLAERVGGSVREADVDRRRRTELANAELEKLALFRPGGTIGRADVDALVAEAVPGSMWAFLDAVASRSTAAAAMLAERLLADATPLAVLVAQLHRRLRDLILVREHLDTGSRPPQIVKDLKLQPYRAQKLTEQAARWDADGLEAALTDLLALDLRSKGISLDGATLQMSAGIDALSLQAWLARHAVLPVRTGRPSGRA